VAGVQGHRQVGDEAVHRLAGAMGDKGAPAMELGQTGGGDGLGDGADLVELDQCGVGDLVGDGAGDNGGIGAEDVVAHQFDAVAKLLVEEFPVLPVVLGQPVFQQAERVFVHQGGVIGDHFCAVELALFAVQVVFAVLVKFAGGRVHGDAHLSAGLEAHRFDGGDDEVQGFAVGMNLGCKAAFITDSHREPFFKRMPWRA